MRQSQGVRFQSCSLAFTVAFLTSLPVFAQSEASQVAAVLSEEIHSPNVSLYQLKQYLLARVARPPAPASAEQWSAQAKRIREHLLNDVVFHGWPREWVASSPRFDEIGTIQTGKGYRIRKFRYEIVPGFQSTALLYEPEMLKPGMPAVLNVNGHVGAPGKAVEYKQKRCINFAKRGILALNLEWLGYGELFRRENQHWFGAHLDLAGANEIGLFYLAMRRGLDFLVSHPMVDGNRVGMTGLSGGGWQTIVLSSLDERVKVSVPVAGFSSLSSRIEARRYGDLGDVEQAASDFLVEQDFTHLVGLMAPRPTLLVYNAEDDCCFRAPLVRPLIYDAMRPLFRLYGKEAFLAWHENQNPGTHNYQKENRVQAYGFFSQHFQMPRIEGEIDSDDEILSQEELAAGLPEDNLTILGLARKLGQQISRAAMPSDPAGRKSWAERERPALREIVRYRPVRTARVWTLANTKSKEVETRSLLFDMDNGLCANALWLRAIGRPDNSPVTIVLHDGGKKAAAAEVSERVNRGEQVLAADLLLIGDAWRDIPAYEYAQLLHGLGERALGHMAAQLIEIGQWIRNRNGASSLRIEVTGMRSQVTSLVAAALAPGLFSELVVRDGIRSLSYLLEKPVEFSEAPELFCLDLFKKFDLDRLSELGGNTHVIVKSLVEPTK